MLALSIFYILKKYDFLNKLFFISVIFSITFVIFDASIQYIFGSNLVGYEKVNYAKSDHMSYLTGFFDDEKKLGSYLVRFFSISFKFNLFSKNKNFANTRTFYYFDNWNFIFFSSERTALFLLIIIYLFYFLIAEKNSLCPYMHFNICFSFKFNYHLTQKYIDFTLKQIGLKEDMEQHELEKFQTGDFVRYFSVEHENLVFTGVEIFKKNVLFGSGIKSFFNECHNLKNKITLKLIKERTN